MSPTTGYYTTIAQLKAITQGDRTDGYSLLVAGPGMPPAWTCWFVYYSAITQAGDDFNIVAPIDGVGGWQRCGTPASISNQTPGGSTSSNSQQQKVLTYSSNGDMNGLFYWLGTQGNTQPYTNPATSGIVKATSSSSLNDSWIASNLTDRGTGIAHTQNEPNAYFEYDLGPNYKLILNFYTLKGRDDAPYHLPRGWTYRVSNDESTWVDIDAQNNNASINQGTWAAMPVANQSLGYRYGRIVQTGYDSQGAQYFVLGEWEFYGTLITTSRS